MSNQFFTEFPVRPEIDFGEFKKIVLNWISGIAKSRLTNLELGNEVLERDQFEKVLASNEAIRSIFVEDDLGSCCGIQHELPDSDGLIWRTDSVLAKSNGAAVLSVRVSCISDSLATNIRAPKRPVLIKQVIESALGARDGDLLVSNSPHYLSDNEVEKACSAILGQSARALPVVYVSARSDDSLPLDVDDLAFELGGLAHVIVEPDRSFSFLLKDETGDRNPYAGAVGIGLPGSPITLRIFPRGSRSEFKNHIVNLIGETFSGKIASEGLEWSDVQQRAIRNERRRLLELRNSQSDGGKLDEWIESFENELKEKDDQIERLRLQNSKLQHEVAAQMSRSQLSNVIEQLRDRVGELYGGELIDRLRNAVASASSKQFALGMRDRAVMDGLLDMISNSPESGRILNELKNATKNERTDAVFSELLVPLGFVRSEAGKHIKFTPPLELDGVVNVIISKTPSDYRSGQNAVSDLRSNLGLYFASN